ncbi:sigma-70 family RNA polymerase sigma factor [Seonamhaeicola sp.]|uniref:RNA polymerase sigma factor n=1 Tax=Seonamhaeicola sp. TaxID=1912245 RepID=UPI00260E0D3F|nr:sigma-70 family RNA polymerase sigma factor [Seonamhaeicola sp.]
MKNQSSQQLTIIEGLRTNSSAILNELYKANFPKILAFVVKDGGTKAQADDIMQDAIIVLWNKVREESFVPHNETAVEAYLFRVAKNKWIDFLRSFHHNQMRSINSLASLKHVDDPPSGLIDTDSENQERLQLALKAFGDIDKNCAVILKKFYFQRKNLKEIAHQLKLNPVSIRNRKYLCLKKLRKLFLTLQDSNHGK